MSAIDRKDIPFVRALLKTGFADRAEDGMYALKLGATHRRLSAAAVAHLVSEGVIMRADIRITPTDTTRIWLKRQLSIGQDAFASQHRVAGRDTAGRHINLNESPLARLASINYLQPHHVLAGERFRKLVERAGLRPRIVMTYNPDPVSSKRGRSFGGTDIPDMAVDARVALQRIYAALPADCTGILFDVCGYEKGLQQVETERRWPRRSAKLVLRISLDQLAQYFGLAERATGRAGGDIEAWLEPGARPDVLG